MSSCRLSQGSGIAQRVVHPEEIRILCRCRHTVQIDWRQEIWTEAQASYVGGLEPLVQASTYSDSHRYHLLNVFCLPSAVIVTVRCRYYDSHFIHV